jgi:hypothetical protein
MTNGRFVHDLKPTSGVMYGLAVIVAAILMVGSAISLAPRPASATSAYSQQTRLACGRCHVNPNGGGPNTAFGKAFAANGHKVPSKKKN